MSDIKKTMEVARGVREGAIRTCARIASQFSVRKGASIYPGLPFESMNEAAKIAAHTTAQQIAAEILDLLDIEDETE